MNDIRKGIPYIPSDPGFYREAGYADWLRTQEGVWLHSTFPFNTRWTLDASRMGPRPFMRRLTPIGFGNLDQYGGVSGGVGFWFDDRGPCCGYAPSKGSGWPRTWRRHTGGRWT